MAFFQTISKSRLNYFEKEFFRFTWQKLLYYSRKIHIDVSCVCLIFKNPTETKLSKAVINAEISANHLPSCNLVV